MSRARAPYIIVLGPDGSGKTTLADALAQSLIEEGLLARRLNFSFGFMPPLSQLLGRSRPSSSREGEPLVGMVKPLSSAHAMILACWYGFDHLLGHFRLRSREKNAVYIFARSYHDFLYQRAYMKLPAFVPKLFLALGPKPDLVAAPWREPDIIHAQKPELTVQEISDQYRRLAEGLEWEPNFIEIDASAGIEATVKQLRGRLAL